MLRTARRLLPQQALVVPPINTHAPARSHAFTSSHPTAMIALLATLLARPPPPGSHRYCDLGTLQTALEKGLFAQPPDPASPIHPSGGPAAAAAAATAAAVGGRRSSFAIFSAPVSGTGLAGGPDDGADGAGGGVVGGGGPLGGPLGAPLGGGLGGGLDTRMLSVQMRPRDVDLRALVATALEVASALRYLHALVRGVRMYGTAGCMLVAAMRACAWRVSEQRGGVIRRDRPCLWCRDALCPLPLTLPPC